jgi:hypothetical protein
MLSKIAGISIFSCFSLQYSWMILAEDRNGNQRSLRSGCPSKASCGIFNCLSHRLLTEGASFILLWK